MQPEPDECAKEIAKERERVLVELARLCVRGGEDPDKEQLRISRVAASQGYELADLNKRISIEKALQGERRRAMKALAAHFLRDDGHDDQVEEEVRSALGYADEEYASCYSEAKAELNQMRDEAATQETYELPDLGWVDFGDREI